jgi:PAS domain S-box-containing protein
MDERPYSLISGGGALTRVVPLLEAAEEGFFDRNVAADEIRFNDRYSTMRGYEPGAFPAACGAWRGLLHTDNWLQVSSVVAELFDGQRESYDIEFLIRNSRGRYQVLRARGRVLSRDKKGRPERIIGIDSDVMERHEVEEHFFRLFRRSSAPLAVLAASTKRFLLVNESFSAYFGRREADFAGRPSDELGLWADRSERERLFSLLLSGEEVDGEEILLRGAAGGSRYGQVYAEGGGWKGKAVFFIVINDVTEINRSEERLEMALEAGGDGLWGWEIDSGKVFYSATWKAMFGFGSDEAEPSYAYWSERIHLLSGPLQGRQRHLRPSSRRRCPHRNGPGRQGAPPGGGHPLSLGRGGVSHPCPGRCQGSAGFGRVSA